jgi:dTDP-4-dehydrorhamnose reductase
MFLIVGGDSEIGDAVIRMAALRGLPVLGTTRRQERVGEACIYLDIEVLDEEWQPPEGVTAACICAAVARLAACANDPEASARVNVTGALLIAKRLTMAGIYTLFLSSDKVFDGSRPHMPADAPLSPVSVYGQLKAETERVFQSMMREGSPVGLLRLAKVISPAMTLFANWKADLSAGRPVRAFNDMTMAPTSMAQVVQAIFHMMERRVTKIAQLTGPQDMSYADVARLIALHIGADPSLVEEASARDFGQPEGATPRHTTLDSGYIREACGLEVSTVEEIVLGVCEISC